VEIDRRKDVLTRDSYAWALQANGEFESSNTEMEKALAIGIRDPAILYRAGVIAAKNGNTANARRNFGESLKQAEYSSVVHLVRRELAKLTRVSE
jgi:Flp pilus assembly protein TadD